jgi:hypothetical protein
MIGKELSRAKILDESFNEVGEICLYEDGFTLVTQRINIKGGYNYIKDLERQSGHLSLGRVIVKLHAYDVLGSDYRFTIAMPEQTYLVLKKKWEQTL